MHPLPAVLSGSIRKGTDISNSSHRLSGDVSFPEQGSLRMATRIEYPPTQPISHEHVAQKATIEKSAFAQKQHCSHPHAAIEVTFHFHLGLMISEKKPMRCIQASNQVAWLVDVYESARLKRHTKVIKTEKKRKCARWLASQP